MRSLLLTVVTIICINVDAASPLRMIKADTPINIDGKLDEIVWEKTPSYDDFKIMESNKPATRRTQARIVYTDNAVIFGIKAYIPNNKIILKKAKRDGKGITAECVEIMLDPTGGADTYYHFIISAANAQLDRKCEQGGYVGDISWNADFRSAVYRGKDFWSCEISIPYRALEMRDSNKKYWKINICRETGGKKSSLGIKGRFNIAGAFRSIVAPAVDLKPFFWDISAPKITSSIQDGKLKVNLAAKVSNKTTAERQAVVTCSMLPPKGRRLLRQCNIKSLPDLASEIKFDSFLLKDSGTYECTVSVRDRGTNRLLARRKFLRKINFLPMSVILKDPHYRQSIFATQKLDYVRYSIKLALDTKKIGEIAQYALFCGTLGIPLIFLSGDEAACKEAVELIPDIETVAVKKGLGRNSAISLSAQAAAEKIRTGAAAALKKHIAKPAKPFVLNGPFTLEKRYFHTDTADAICNDPRQKRIDSQTVQISSNNIIDIIYS